MSRNYKNIEKEMKHIKKIINWLSDKIDNLFLWVIKMVIKMRRK